MILSSGLMMKGLIISMREFKVPEEVLLSPTYYDAILWVYVHMFVIGVLLLTIGLSVTDVIKQSRISLLLFVITSVYTYLDFRSSDSVLGNGIYKGESSIIPGVISLAMNIIFLFLTVHLFKNNKKA
jgi:hypothetical protein